MILPSPGSTRTDKLLPYTTLFRSCTAHTAMRYSTTSCITGEKTVPANRRCRVTICAHWYGHCATDTRSGTRRTRRSEEHTSELQSLMRISYAVFCLKKQTNKLD